MTKFVYSDNNETFFNHDIVDFCLDESVGSVLTLYKGVSQKPSIEEFFPDGNHLLEYMMERAFDVYGDYSDSFLENVSQKQVEELENNVEMVLTNWFNKHNFDVNFYHVHDITELKVKVTSTEGDYEIISEELTEEK